MLMPGFDFYEPKNIQEALEFMSRSKGKTKILSGGTDLIVNLKKGLLSPKSLISINRLKDLNQIRASKTKIRIGSCCTVADIAENDHIKDIFMALNEGAQRLGSPLIRNLATIGGNIITARPAADLPPVLIAYGAELVLRKISGERIIKIDSFIKGPGKTLVKPDEILTEIRIKNPSKHSGAAYIKMGVRETLEISMVNIAALIELDKPGGLIKSARIVLGSVAPIPFLSPSAEKVLLGEKPSKAIFTKAGEEAAKDSRPITDFRASAEYRREMVKVLTTRALSTALSRIQAS